MDEQTMGQAKEAKQENHTAESGEQTANAREKAAQADYEPEYRQPGPRRPGEQRDNAFNTLAWLVEGATGLVEELRHSDLGLSEEFWVHLYAMRREGLLAARSAIDGLLAKSEQESRDVAEKIAREARRGEVSIE